MSEHSTPNATHGSRTVPDDVTVVAGPGSDGVRGQAVGEESLSDLLSRLVQDLTLLLRQEVELAKIELRRELTTAGRASAMLVAGAVLAFVAVLLLAWAAAWGLAALMPTGLAFLIVAIVVGAGAAGAMIAGRKKFQKVDITPHEAVDSMQRDKQVLAERRPQ